MIWFLHIAQYEVFNQYFILKWNKTESNSVISECHAVLSAKFNNLKRKMVTFWSFCNSLDIFFRLCAEYILVKLVNLNNKHWYILVIKRNEIHSSLNE